MLKKASAWWTTWRFILSAVNRISNSNLKPVSPAGPPMAITSAHPSPTSATTVPARSRCAPAPPETLGRTIRVPSQVHWRRDKRRQSAPKCGGCAVGRKFCFACVEVTSRRPIVCCCRRTSEHRGRSTTVRSPMPARRSLSNTLARCARSEPGHRRFRRDVRTSTAFSVAARYRIDPGTNLTDVAMNDSASTATRLLAMGFCATIRDSPATRFWPSSLKLLVEE